MPTYRWSCLACGTGNAPESTQCDHCGCPPSARFEQIAQARASVGITEPPEGQSLMELSRFIRELATQRHADGSRPWFVSLAIEVGCYVVLALIFAGAARSCA